MLKIVLILSGISCYQCESSTSFAKCSTKQETVNCAFPRNYCFKQKNTTGGNIDQETVFSKDCTSADQCRKKGNHSLECCEDDLCNTGNPDFCLCTCQNDVSLYVSLCARGFRACVFAFNTRGGGTMPTSWCPHVCASK